MRLLIADDQTSLHTFLNKMMDWTSLGIKEIQHAYDGRETLQLIKEFIAGHRHFGHTDAVYERNRNLKRVGRMLTQAKDDHRKCS